MPNEHLTGHANPWRTAEHARDWIARFDREPRDRSEEFRTLIGLLPYAPDAPIHVLELGAGHGALAEQVLETYPSASTLALDLQPVMIEEGRRRLARFGERIEFARADLEQPGWSVGTDTGFDAVVSSLAIHHLQRQRKAELAHEVFERLRPGGVFLNLDYVSPASETLMQRYRRAQEFADGSHGGQDHSHGGHDHGGHGQNLAGGHATDSLFDQLDDLRAAGFVDVDVFWKRLGLALFGGTRP